MVIEERIKYLENYLEGLVKKGAFPGACYGLVTLEEGYYGALGNAQVVPGIRKMEEDTIFDLASLTKVIATTTSILILIENGELRLNERVKNILPKFKYEDTTVLQLLNHTSGLPSEVKFYNFCKSADEVIKALYKIDTVYVPKNRVVYSDLNFILLGLIVEKLGERLDKFSKKYIFDPLEMEDTGFNPPEDKIKRIAASEYHEGKAVALGRVHDGNSAALGGVSGHAGVFSTVRDLGKFAGMFLNEGIYKNRSFLSLSTINLMNKCHTEGLNQRRGLGWKLKNIGDDMGDLSSEYSMFHTGFTGTSILIDRELGMSFILLTNRIHPTRDNMQLVNLRGSINNIAVTAVRNK